MSNKNKRSSPYNDSLTPNSKKRKIKEENIEYGIMTNINPITNDDITDWNAGRIPIAIAHPAATGHGLNLQSGGSTVIWFGLAWSLELYQQANARIWRQGQTETVVIIHMACRDTIDEQVIQALERKELTQTALINAVKARIRKDGEADGQHG